MFEIEVINKILGSRGILNIEQFLNPTDICLIPFELMHNIETAANIVIDGIENNKRFMIHFDVDTDGCSSGAIMYRFLSNFTNKLNWTINEGKAHGLYDNCGEDEVFNDIDILIIVDSLNNNIEPYK